MLGISPRGSGAAKIGSSWRDDGKECPAEIEVVELSRLLGIG